MITWAERIWGSLPPMLGLSIINMALALVLTLTFQSNFAFSLHFGLWFWLLVPDIFLWPDPIERNYVAPESLHLWVLNPTYPAETLKNYPDACCQPF